MRTRQKAELANFILKRKDDLKRRHYLLLANQVTHWFNARPNVVDKYKAQFGSDFCLVLWRDGPEDDAYVIPIARLDPLFTKGNLVSGTGGLRWHGGIIDDRLSLRDCDESIADADCYNAFHRLKDKPGR